LPVDVWVLQYQEIDVASVRKQPPLTHYTFLESSRELYLSVVKLLVALVMFPHRFHLTCS